jgi:hypothetical protein
LRQIQEPSSSFLGRCGMRMSWNLDLFKELGCDIISKG